MMLSYEPVRNQLPISRVDHSYPKMSKVSLVACQAVDTRGFSYTLCYGDNKSNDGVLKDKIPGLLNQEMLAALLEVK